MTSLIPPKPSWTALILDLSEEIIISLFLVRLFFVSLAINTYALPIKKIPNNATLQLRKNKVTIRNREIIKPEIKFKKRLIDFTVISSWDISEDITSLVFLSKWTS